MSDNIIHLFIKYRKNLRLFAPASGKGDPRDILVDVGGQHFACDESAHAYRSPRGKDNVVFGKGRSLVRIMHEKGNRISLLFVGEPLLGILGRQHNDRRGLIYDVIAMRAVRYVGKISDSSLRTFREKTGGEAAT